MNYASTWHDALGNSLGIPVFSSTNVTGGRKVTVRGGNIAKGEVIRMCTDDSETGVETSLSTGEGSPQVTYEKLTDGSPGTDDTAFLHAGVFAIALEAIADNEEGYICDFGICKANIDLADGTYLWGTPLVPSFNDQELIAATTANTSNGKVVAILAEEIVVASDVPDEAWVIFSGLFPLGNVSITDA